jgi:hypothetical protein
MQGIVTVDVTSGVCKFEAVVYVQRMPSGHCLFRDSGYYVNWGKISYINGRTPFDAMAATLWNWRHIVTKTVFARPYSESNRFRDRFKSLIRKKCFTLAESCGTI